MRISSPLCSYISTHSSTHTHNTKPHKCHAKLPTKAELRKKTACAWEMTEHDGHDKCLLQPSTHALIWWLSSSSSPALGHRFVERRCRRRVVVARTNGQLTNWLCEPSITTHILSLCGFVRFSGHSETQRRNAVVSPPPERLWSGVSLYDVSICVCVSVLYAHG